MNMTISMWNFHNWFQSKGISHVCSIRSQEAEIIGVYLRSEQPPSDGYALLSEASEYSGYCTTLSFGEDYIYFHELTVMEVMDEINYMFTIYHYWQQGLKRINLARGSLKELLALSYEIIPYPILIFRGNELLAYSPQFEDQILELWESFSSLSLPETCRRVHLDSDKLSDCTEPVLSCSPLFQGRQVIFNNLRSNGGQFVRIAVFANEQALSPGHIQLMSELTKAIRCNLNIWQHRTDDSAVHPTEYFLSCASGKDDSTTADTVLHRLGWNSHDRFTVFRFEPLDTKLSILSDKLCQLLQARFPHAYCLVQEYTVHMICNLEQSETIPSEEFVTHELPAGCFIASQSNISSDFALIPQLIQQAERTLKKAHEMKLSFLSSDSIMLDYISQFLLKQPNIRSLIHPVICHLMQEDTGHYLQTLHAYLYFGGNCTAAAKHLKIHRNTLISRLEKIQSLTGLALDDPHIRETLQLSMLIAAPSIS